MEEQHFYDLQVNKLNNYLKDKVKVQINIEDLKITDTIYIDFIPDSQKYINALYPKCGSIKSINNDEIIIINLEGFEDMLLHDGVSYLGTSLGYSYLIFKILPI